MATIQGTAKADILTGTTGDDRILALDGNDRIIGSTGFDTVDGGTGHDTIDFSGVNLNLFAGFSSFGLSGYNISDGRGTTGGPGPIDVATLGTKLNNIETIVGNPNQSNTIQEFFSRAGSLFGYYDIDLSKNRVTFYSTTDGKSQTFTVKNFDNIDIQIGSHRLGGNNRNNKIAAQNSVIIGSKGNDTLTGSRNTLDYSNLGRAVKFSFEPQIITLANFQNSATDYTFTTKEGSIDKGSFGKDKFTGVDKIIGANNQSNTLDTSTATGVHIDLNLANNSLKIYTPNQNLPELNIIQLTPNPEFEVVNFVNAIGTKGNDKIVGGNKNSTLTGGGGNDTITGGTGKDTITGTDSTARGVGEVDTLTGGGGKDKFILGDKNGAYYVGKGNNDYALITDFNLFQDSISIGNLKNYSFALEGTNTINLYSGTNVNHRDLIAKIQISGGISSLNSKSKSIMGSDASLNAIVCNIDIISGSQHD